MSQQPSGRMCFACGKLNDAGLQIIFYDDGKNACRADIVIDARHQGFPGLVHGGIVATILDEAMGRTALSGEANRFMYTAKIEVHYRQPVPLNQQLIVRARLDKNRGRVAMASAQLYLAADDMILAEATCILAAIPDDSLAKMGLDVANWR